jgi:hypothetical protein
VVVEEREGERKREGEREGEAEARFVGFVPETPQALILGGVCRLWSFCWHKLIFFP